ncbi:MAG: helix-turn-helix domain-containing protein [Phycisphaerae bacterium]
MNPAKHDRLKAQGWQVGSAADFLQLTAEKSAYIELRLKLAHGLRRQRQQRRLTQVQLARMLASSQSRVAKMVAGDPSVSLDLLIRSHLALGSSPQELAVLIGATT